MRDSLSDWIPAAKKEDDKKDDKYPYKNSKWEYIVSDETYSYQGAVSYCQEYGYTLVPYYDKQKAAPAYELCYLADRACWLWDPNAGFCTYLDPQGDGKIYDSDCGRKNHALCYKWLYR
ncbi:hypothetical protein PLESTF_000155100 [Pleodorina starrii]|nr:hypothetical protein PLESTM_000037600 [Pleodorina starrii]GLC64380.1 hypothetical protein PLESTF_000155100 [Pleodorina starrii]